MCSEVDGGAGRHQLMTSECPRQSWVAVGAGMLAVRQLCQGARSIQGAKRPRVHLPVYAEICAVALATLIHGVHVTPVTQARLHSKAIACLAGFGDWLLAAAVPGQLP